MNVSGGIRTLNSKRRKGLNLVCIPIPPQIHETEREGIEPSNTVLETVMLPLHHPSMKKLRPGFEPGKPDYKAGVFPLKLSEHKRL